MTSPSLRKDFRHFLNAPTVMLNLVSNLLMDRPTTKFLSLVLVSIILYVIGNYLHNRGQFKQVDFPSNIGVERSGLRNINLLHPTRTGDETLVKRGLEEHGENLLDNESRKLPDIETKNIEITNLEHGDHSLSLHGPRRKFLFVFSYYEQLGRATNNLFDLASLAKNKNRLLVIPFVNNSRMSGLPDEVSLFTRKQEKLSQKTYALLSEYFNVDDLNSKLKSRGYSTLTSFRDLQSHCAKRFDLVVYFLFDNERYKKATASWYSVSDGEVTAMYEEAREHNGWIDCSLMKQSRLAKQMGFKVSRYICVDPEVIRAASDFENNVLNGANCVGIVQWRGTGQYRVHFPLDPAITQPLQPSELEFNPRLVELARIFVKKMFHGDFIGVHVRSERHIAWKGVKVTKRCMLKLASRVHETQDEYGIKQVFLASDLTEYGSDTLMNYAGLNDPKSLSTFLQKVLGHPATFKPEGILYDTGAAAIVEMNVLSMATSLFTLGGGNFQEWAVGIFRKRHNNEQGRLHRMCRLN